MAQLNNFLGDLKDITFVLPDDGHGNKTEIIVSDGNTRTQYGNVKEVGVRVVYEFQWPLMPHEQTDNGVAVDGLNGAGTGGNYTNTGYTRGVAIPIKITYKVPGLQYYPDLNIT